MSKKNPTGQVSFLTEEETVKIKWDLAGKVDQCQKEVQLLLDIKIRIYTFRPQFYKRPIQNKNILAGQKSRFKAIIEIILLHKA